jgi:hypothetical protein
MAVFMRSGFPKGMGDSWQISRKVLAIQPRRGETRIATGANPENDPDPNDPTL